ncbi:PAS domain-containing protein [Natronorubrum sp. JWXQ-INN-674]|uniref:histidine kinase n=1 Tax=Natronorubrum halalkaliphilum TaxID=2691917 RepID=A0A6B0VQU0_9EURY|nr:PAS domain-containing protein [Natronorubrum halalkaliphilum]MXV63543.1 PAS domain-containing protein [Natronorubrum halalkaliphilum]
MATSDPPTGQLRSRVRQQEVVAELGQQALESSDIDSLLTDAVNAVRETLDADHGAIFEVRPEDDAVSLRRGIGWGDDLTGSATIATDSDSQVGYTLAAEGPVAVENVETEDRFSVTDLLADHDVTSGISAVIGSVEEPWGVISAHTTDRREFTEHDLSFVENVANIVASAIENRRAHRSQQIEAAFTDRIVETSPMGITVITDDGEVSFANERAEEIFGRSRDEITSLRHDAPDWDARDEAGDPVPESEMPFRQVVDCGESVYNVELNVRQPDGTRVWISVNGAPLGTSGDEVQKAVFAIEDITERKRLEGELETTVDRITDAFFGLDAEWTITYVNDRARALIDPDDEGLIGRTLWEAFPAAVDSTFETEYRHAMKTQEPTSFEEYFPPLETWFEVHAYPSQTGLSVYFRDVSERKRVERELHENNRTLQRLYSITADRELTFEQKVQQLLELGRERLGLDVGFMADIDERDDRFEVVYVTGDDDRLEPGSISSLSETYCRRTIEADELLVLTNAPEEGWADDHAYEKWDFDSYLGGQIRVDGELYGTLCFADDAARSTAFTPAERSFVELVTQWLSYELERQQYRRELEVSERRYRTLVEHFPNGIVALFDDDLQYTLAGGQILDEIDTSVDDFVGQTVRERYEGETRATFESNLRAALAGEQTSFEYRLHGREWLAYTVPVADEQGDVFAGMIMVQDVTDRKEQERKLREREARLERFKKYTDDVLNAIDDVFYVLGEDGSFQRWNETLCDVTGYTDAEVDSMTPLDFFAGADQERIATAIQDVFETGNARVEADVVTRDGETIPYEFIATGLENPAGNTVLAGIGRDISERKENQRRLEELVSDLESSNERLEQFAYAASHDLQEPLRMVSSYLRLVERRYADELDADGEEFIEYAVDGAERMQEMINGLLAYSRIDTQGDPFEVVDTEAVLEDVLTDLEVRIEETDAEITVESLPAVYGDPDQLRQVFQNLLDNAITYAGEQTPRISVFAEKNGQEWSISVRDRGIGIDPADSDRIFQVFDRLHSIEEYPGTGIGLAVCQRIVERHDGDIRVESEPGEGSTFSVTLPAPPETGEPGPTKTCDSNE